MRGGLLWCSEFKQHGANPGLQHGLGVNVGSNTALQVAVKCRRIVEAGNGCPFLFVRRLTG